MIASTDSMLKKIEKNKKQTNKQKKTKMPLHLCIVYVETQSPK